MEKRWLLGDVVEAALTKAGITKERVESLLGRPCGCDARRDALNALDLWARRVITGKVADADKHLVDALGGNPGDVEKAPPEPAKAPELPVKEKPEQPGGEPQ
jgi:hypothetical protein